MKKLTSTSTEEEKAGLFEKTKSPPTKKDSVVESLMPEDLEKLRQQDLQQEQQTPKPTIHNHLQNKLWRTPKNDELGSPKDSTQLGQSKLGQKH